MNVFTLFTLSSITFGLFIVNVILTFRARENCSSIMEDIITYDARDYEIKRHEAYITGGIRQTPAFLLIGIPVVYREYNHTAAIYFDQTINALLNPLTKEERKTIQIIIILADEDAHKRQYMLKLTIQRFGDEIKSGLINVIGIPSRFYLELKNLPQTQGDSPQRMYWRSKQALDFVFIFNYVHKLSSYYMQIEDDVIAEYDYYHVIKRDINKYNNKLPSKIAQQNANNIQWSYRKGKSWCMLSYYRSGFIGRLFPNEYTPAIASVLKAYYTRMPVDLTLLGYFTGIYNIKTEHTSELFKHIGKQSSSLGT